MSSRTTPERPEAAPAPHAPHAPRPAAGPGRSYRYYDLIMAAFVTVLLCTNLISAPKRVELGGFVFGAGVLFFPISYLFGDILTEVYGYARSRKVVWAGFGALLFATLVSQVVLRMPPDPSWSMRVAVVEGAVVPAPAGAADTVRLDRQFLWETVFGGTWRVVLASMVGFFAGEFVNSFVLAKLKVLTRGKLLWTRTIGSTIAGEAADTLLFYPIAFLGAAGWPPGKILAVMGMNYLLKVSWEVLATPLTYRIVGFLKRAEHEDYFDYDTDFTPFSLKT
jgi:uncharacterized PurR-regulated membrane protein YhhQ (DUF165 family)